MCVLTSFCRVSEATIFRKRAPKGPPKEPNTRPEWRAFDPSKHIVITMRMTIGLLRVSLGSWSFERCFLTSALEKCLQFVIHLGCQTSLKRSEGFVGKQTLQYDDATNEWYTHIPSGRQTKSINFFIDFRIYTNLYWFISIYIDWNPIYMIFNEFACFG